ncbi:MAG: peptide chain release factor N(5)-glutamine methyltransferase [Limnothrix sp. RL_2_0]|nr:peptide chain release factor N(5)-glutamine methyltransferase [Limnothrix sp. RL_2_0]
MIPSRQYQIEATAFYQWRQWAQAQAIAADISVSEVDWFLQALTAITPLALRLEGSQPIASAVSLEQLSNLWQQRVTQRVPVQYLVGKAPWRNFELLVTPDVLVPRPETEYLIDLAQNAVAESDLDLATGQWVDLGTGSGAIAIGLAAAFPEAKIHAVDYSKAALVVAQQNCQVSQKNSQIQFYQGNWWEPLAHLKGKVAGMISNPPYIPTEMLQNLQPEVFRHEPHSALDGGQDGLKDIHVLVSESPDYLVAGGIWLIELMRGQGTEVAELLTHNHHYQDIRIINDFSGGDRYVSAKKV